MISNSEEMKLQDMVEIPDEYFKLDPQRKETIDNVIRKLYESQEGQRNGYQSK